MYYEPILASYTCLFDWLHVLSLDLVRYAEDV